MKAFFNRAPLSANTRTHLAAGKIKPEGWLKQQLMIQAEGVTAHIDENWPDLGNDCEWLGGSQGSWERAPYYLDGLVSLAYVTEDEKLISKAKKYIEWILSSQREDGWFGPANNRDYWPLTICLKALFTYFEATADKRVLVFMDKYFRYQYQNLSEHPMKGWACARGGDNIYMILKLYNITGQKYLPELCKKIKAQTLDWTSIFDTFPHTAPLSRSMAWDRLREGIMAEKDGLCGENHPFFSAYYHRSHGVNNAMGLKTPGVISTLKTGFKEQNGFKNGWGKLMRHHGTANGIFVADEHLNGNNPSGGTELCAVVESMYSIETLLDMGDFGNDLPDILEKLAYNALPATFSADMLRHQYLQQTNQIACTDKGHHWYNNGMGHGIFRTEPDYMCCSANQHQGWPKFVSSLWYATSDEGLWAMSYAPCTVSHAVDKTPVRLTVGGSYPFGENVDITISAHKSVEFPLYLRIPFWAVNPIITLPGGEFMTVKAGETTVLRQKWNPGDTIRLTLTAQPRVTHWSHQSAAVEVGPLLMALDLKVDKKPIETRFGREISEYTTRDEWAYALLTDKPMKLIRSENMPGAFKTGDAPIKVMVKVARCEQWNADGDDAGSIPIQPDCSGEEERTIELIPYGYTDLRIGQFPAAKE